MPAAKLYPNLLVGGRAFHYLVGPPVVSGPAPTRQTIGVSLVTSGSSTTDGPSFTVASTTFDPTKLYLLVAACAGQIAAMATPSGWTVTTANQIGSGLSRRLNIFHASGLSGAATTLLASAGETYTSGVWYVIELTNVNLASPFPQAAQVAGTGQANNTTFTTTLNAFEHPTNINLTFVGLGSQNAVTHDANFAELSPEVQIGSGTLQLEAQWAVNRVACTPSWASAGACVTSLEIKSVLA